MPVEQWVVVAIAVVALGSVLAVALLAVQLRRTRAEVRDAVRQLQHDDQPPAQHEPTGPRADGAVPVLTDVPAYRVAPTSGDPAVVTSDGRTMVLPSSEQVVHATMGRTMVRGAVLTHGLRYALRPENRDRIRSLVRRDYRRRRKSRLRAGRRAARTTPVPPAETQAWLGSRTPAGTEQEGS